MGGACAITNRETHATQTNRHVNQQELDVFCQNPLSGVYWHLLIEIADCPDSRMANHCQKNTVGEQVCYLTFADGKPDHSVELPYETARGEMLIADLDEHGRIVGIELVGPTGQKQCQG